MEPSAGYGYRISRHLANQPSREDLLSKLRVQHGWCTRCGVCSIILAIQLGQREWGYLCMECVKELFERYSSNFELARSHDIYAIRDSDGDVDTSIAPER